MKFNTTYTDNLSGIVKIPKDNLLDNRLILYRSSNSELFEFTVEDNSSEIHIFANPGFANTINKEKEVLKKTSDGFRTKGMWTKNRNTKFKKRN